ncbi:MAG: phenylacetate--CoA ligase family protein [Burkholderiales bacterium]
MNDFRNYLPAVPRSTVAGIEWPALTNGRATALLALLDQFAHSERLAPEELLAQQFRQIDGLAAHAYAHAPYWRDRLARAGYRPGGALREVWPSLPVLERAEVQAQGAALRCAVIPQGHGGTGEVATSGSTGMPVRVLKTELTNLFWEAVTLRDHLWHGRDFSKVLAGIRWFPDGTAAAPDGESWPDWGAPVSTIYPSGPCHGLAITATVAQQAAWLARVQPAYLVLFPSLLPDLIRECARQGIALSALKEVRTVGECVDDATRALCLEAWQVPVHDLYSAQEVGYMTVQCEAGSHHVQAETVLLEVLDDAGGECAPGETGRIVVTPLHNFATPLFRYAVGDYAEVGTVCACGRGLPVLTRILGRARNMLTLPDGGRLWPRLAEMRYHEVLPVRQFQLVQKTPDALELRLVSDRKGTAAEEATLQSMITARLGYPFALTVTYLDAIPRSKSGKFEDFRSELND